MRALALFLLLTVAASSLAQVPKAGEIAPEIAVEKVISPDSAAVPTLAKLRGKVVVMEFWGVWCGHCVENIPHLNQLSEKFAPRGVEFLSISDDREKVVRDFLQKTKIGGTVTVDADSSAIKGYGVNAFPTTLILGRDGKILARTHPALVTEETLEDALAGRPLRLKEEKAEVSSKPVPKPIFEVWVRPAESDQMMGGYGPFGVNGRALTPQLALAWAYGVPTSRLIVEAKLPDEKYDVKAEGSSEDKRTLPALQLALESAFGVATSPEEREIDAYVLAKIAGQEPKLEKPGPERATAGASRDGISGTNYTLDWLVSALDGRAGVPVVDETGLKDKYTYDLKFSATDFETLRKALREQLGLDLRKEKRKLPVLVVRKG